MNKNGGRVIQLYHDLKNKKYKLTKNKGVITLRSDTVDNSILKTGGIKHDWI